jgi:hypothetical protein
MDQERQRSNNTKPDEILHGQNYYPKVASTRDKITLAEQSCKNNVNGAHEGQ